MGRVGPSARSLVAFTVAIGLLSSVGTAYGHGAAEPPPPPPPPPFKRDPYVPMPPPLPGQPPKLGGPTTPTPKTPMPTPTPPGGGGPTTPTPTPPVKTPPRVDPPPTAPRKIPELGDRKGRRGLADTSGGWVPWWEANADAFRSGRRLEGVVTGDSPIAQVGGGGVATDAARAKAKAIEDVILPTLRAVLDPSVHEDSDVLASAFLALGKTTNDPADIQRLRAALRRREGPELPREGAALGLGLLRRTDAARTFDGRELDRVRTDLFDAIDDDRIPVRTRCFAALSLGLLAGQPTAPGDAFAKDGKLVVRGLWTRIQEDRAGDETAVALLVALSMQCRQGVPEAVLTGLRGLVATGLLGGRRHGGIVQAQAALTLARLADVDAAGVFLGILKGRAQSLEVRRSAILALGVLAPRLDEVRRVGAIDALVSHARRGDPDTTGLAWITAGRVLAADLADGSSAILTRTAVADGLADVATRGAHAVRPFAALGLALAAEGRGRSFSLPDFVPLRARALSLLREGAADGTMDPGSRGAFLIGLGLAVDRPSSRLLAQIVRDGRGATSLRAHAAAGLGLLGEARDDVLSALHDAMTERSSEDLRREASRALGFLGDRRAVPVLVKDIEAGGADVVLARAAVALGSIGDPSAVRPLADIVMARRASDLSRAVAVAGLGLLGDMEDVPTLSLLSTDSNYLSRTASLAEAVSLL